MNWRHSIDRHRFFGGSGIIEIYSTLVLVSNVQGFGGKSMLNWGQIVRLWAGGDIILVSTNLISLLVFLSCLALLFVPHMLQKGECGWQGIRLLFWKSLP